jgi:hypothetical protein
MGRLGEETRTARAELWLGLKTTGGQLLLLVPNHFISRSSGLGGMGGVTLLHQL